MAEITKIDYQRWIVSPEKLLQQIDALVDTKPMVQPILTYFRYLLEAFGYVTDMTLEHRIKHLRANFLLGAYTYCMINDDSTPDAVRERLDTEYRYLCMRGAGLFPLITPKPMSVEDYADRRFEMDTQTLLSIGNIEALQQKAMGLFHPDEFETFESTFGVLKPNAVLYWVLRYYALTRLADRFMDTPLEVVDVIPFKNHLMDRTIALEEHLRLTTHPDTYQQLEVILNTICQGI